MPGSKRTGKSLIAHWVSQHSDIKRVLDVDKYWLTNNEYKEYYDNKHNIV